MMTLSQPTGHPRHGYHGHWHEYHSYNVDHHNEVIEANRTLPDSLEAELYKSLNHQMKLCTRLVCFDVLAGS